MICNFEAIDDVVYLRLIQIWLWFIFTAIGPSYVQCTCPPGYGGNGIGPNGCTLNPTDCTGSCQNGQCVVSF